MISTVCLNKKSNLPCKYKVLSCVSLQQIMDHNDLFCISLDGRYPHYRKGFIRTFSIGVKLDRKKFFERKGDYFS